MKEQIKKLEQNFLKELKSIKIEQNSENKVVNKLQYEIEIASKKSEFYEKYRQESNEYLLNYKTNRILVEKLPKILEIELEKDEIVKKNIEAKNSITEDEIKQKIDKFEKARSYQLEEFEFHKKILKQKLHKKTISRKAYKNTISQKKEKMNKTIEYLKLSLPKYEYDNNINVAKNTAKLETKKIYEEINIEISEYRRRIKLDNNQKTSRLIPYLTFFIPGLGQYIYKEYLKAFMYFIGTLFTYLLAIPYAIGYGNYRGQGLYGLYTLANNGGRLDKSLIFMVEGIIALALVFIAMNILIFSFKDVYRTNKNINTGIRPLSTYEIKRNIADNGFPYIITNIAGILLLFIVIIPITTTIFLSFTNMDPNHQSKFAWVGFENYKLLLKAQGIAGGPFWNILLWTLIWTALASTMSILVGFGLSLIAHNDRIRGKKIIRTIYLLPWAVPAFVTIMFFSIMTSNNGVITQVIEKLTGQYIEIKNNALYTRTFLIFLQTWLGSSYIFLLSTGVLQGISEELYEAAEIDGATSWQKISKIIVPIVLLQTAPLLIGQYTFNFNNFSIIYLFNGGGPFNTAVYGNIAGSTDLLISYIYKLTIQKNYQAIGSAITVFISLGLILFTYIGFKNSKSFKKDGGYE